MIVLTRRMLHELLSFDHAFAEARDGAPAEATLRLLAGLLAEHDDIATGLGGPPRDWADIAANLQMLAGGERRFGSTESWLSLTREGEQLADADPVAASLAGLYAMAAWEGAAGEAIFELPMAVEPNPGWAIFPLALARSLQRADALKGAAVLVDIALDVLEGAYGAHSDPRIRATVDDYLTVQAGVDRRFAELRRELAWELRESCSPSEPSFRPEVAAMLWTLGDVPHALSLAATEALPSLALIEGVVHETMRRLHRDPFTQYLWLELKDRPPFDLRAHKTLFGRVNAIYGDTQAGGLEAALGLLGVSPAHTYARALIAHFRGTLTQEHRQAVLEVGSVVKMSPELGARFAALLRLIATPEEVDLRPSWQGIAAGCTAAVRRARRAGEDSDYDLSPDIPFYYLDNEDGSQALDTLERYRAAGLWYWLAIAPPARRPEGVAVEALVKREDELLDELRGIHLVLLLPDLPRHYSRVTTELDVDTRTLLDPEWALERLSKVEEELDGVQQKLADTDPAYATRRGEPAIGLDEFSRLLGPG